MSDTMQDTQEIPQAAAVAAPPTPSPFDFADSRDTETHEFVPNDPVSDAPIVGTSFTLWGEDTAEYQKAEAYAQKILTQSARKKKSEGGGTKYTVNLLARAIAGWKGVVWKGALMPYSVSNAEMLLSNVAWLRDQLSEFLRDREERLGKSGGSTAV